MKRLMPGVTVTNACVPDCRSSTQSNGAPLAIAVTTLGCSEQRAALSFRVADVFPPAARVVVTRGHGETGLHKPPVTVAKGRATTCESRTFRK